MDATAITTRKELIFGTIPVRFPPIYRQRMCSRNEPGDSKHSPEDGCPGYVNVTYKFSDRMPDTFTTRELCRWCELTLFEEIDEALDAPHWFILRRHRSSAEALAEVQAAKEAIANSAPIYDVDTVSHEGAYYTLLVIDAPEGSPSRALVYKFDTTVGRQLTTLAIRYDADGVHTQGFEQVSLPMVA